MSMLIRTDQVAAPDLVDFLREVMATMWLPMDCRPEDRKDYDAEFRASGLGPMQVVVMDVPPATVRRTPALISRADPDMLKIALVRGGSCVVSCRLSFYFYNTPDEVDRGRGRGIGDRRGPPGARRARAPHRSPGFSAVMRPVIPFQSTAATSRNGCRAQTGCPAHSGVPRFRSSSVWSSARPR